MIWIESGVEQRVLLKQHRFVRTRRYQYVVHASRSFRFCMNAAPACITSRRSVQPSNRSTTYSQQLFHINITTPNMSQLHPPHASVNTAGRPSTLHNHVTSLLSLPGAVRKLIWRYALIENQAVVVKRAADIMPPLIRTCQQLHQETPFIYFSKTHFHVQVLDYDAALWFHFTDEAVTFSPGDMDVCFSYLFYLLGRSFGLVWQSYSLFLLSHVMPSLRLITSRP